MEGSHEVEVTVIDNAGLVVGLTPTVPPGVDVVPRDGDSPGPRVANVPGDDRSLAVGWELLYCDTDATLSVERFDGQIVLTFNPGGPWDCDLVGGRYALALSLSEFLPAGTVVRRAVGELGVGWSVRFKDPDRGQDLVNVFDRTLLSIGAVADEPPALAPGPTGIAVANPPGQKRAVSVAWRAPCGTESTLVLEQTGRRIAFQVELLEIVPCTGSDDVYGTTVTFSRLVPDADVVATVVR